MIVPRDPLAVVPTHSKIALATAVTAALALTTPLTTASARAPTRPPAPLIAASDPVPGMYIVTLEPTVGPSVLAERLDLAPTFVYTTALHGFAVALSPAQLTAVRNTPGVKSVEEDARVDVRGSATAGRAPTGVWGLDRIDQREWNRTQGTGDGKFTTAGDGSGVTAYVLDTGIDYAHEEFGGRASFGFDAVRDGRNGQDCQGHGTHVAGTVAGTTYGVAKKAALVSVRVLGCDGQGTFSGIIAGLDWVAKNAKQPAVLNGSLGGGRSDVLNSAATALSDAGVLPVLAAGNDAKDACDVSPASASRVVTVGAGTRADEQAGFSNFGRCLSLYAPGESVVSARLGGGSVAQDGTSMASPHVAGVAALYKQAHPDAAPLEVAGFLADRSTKDALSGLGPQSPNQLVFTDGL